MTVRPFDTHHPQLGARAYIDPTAVVVGDVHVGADSSVWPMAVLRGDIHRIRIGARSNIQDGTVVHVTHDSEHSPGGHAAAVGDDVTVGHRVVLHGCRVGDRCLIGMGAVVMDGALVHADTIIGAGSLVTQGKELEGGYLWTGSPARRVRTLTEREREYIRYAAAHYVQLKDRYCEKC
ncbi:MAG: gamma carbonic anhydrase family protein, partial [Gammaproteobacteria bacterium]|nr:gamma carbonic anhydrase family protein [Gammaproteobacteria bacterium]NIR97747.1 gamma carbonic anhydrase family protein [Gammaproteobacteria bacterium]NIT63457.1 gamma carbonic anhydrase family protein [Gammaproteobacteria bacterium]NIV20389.1 gamma carbonic anhydrase family protein [Gammaproteobacteria bacterium]NIX10907.1 gamma carbonic anhydrase family protein [Gammaproteobacteria bacterium]